MRILIVTECLRTGGAQIFALRMLKHLSEKHDVWLFYLYPELLDEALVKKYDMESLILSSGHFFKNGLSFVDRVLRKLRIDFSLRAIFVRRELRKVVRNNRIELIHSNMFKADFLAAKVAQMVNIPIVVTMHGSYENFLKCYFSKSGEVISNYPTKLAEHLRKLDGIAYLTEKNLDSIDFVKGGYESFKEPLKRKIYNGFYEIPFLPRKRSELNIDKTDFVFGMVARDIPEKGWQSAIDAFLVLEKHAQLVLVGGGRYLDSLKSQYINSNIHFVGQSSNPLEWIQMFNVGLLPSTYDESLPNVIVEYLHLGVPAIATDIGETSSMIATENGLAGRIIPINDPLKIVSNLAKCMNEFLEMGESDFLAIRGLSKKASKKFDMRQCVSEYTSFYSQVVSLHKTDKVSRLN